MVAQLAPRARTAPGPARVALYSHDAQGLGHVRRNLAVAAALAGDSPARAILLVTGAREAGGIPVPPGTDVLTLPALRKGEDGAYGPRRLGIASDEFLAMRSAMLTAALTRFAPDVLIVDKHPDGIGGELRPALEALRATGRTRLVLGLREVLDEPEAVAREWRASRAMETVEALYDRVWVYGDPTVFDTVGVYGLPPAVARRTRYTGYLDRRARPDPPRGVRRDARLVDGLRLGPGGVALCLVGGGEDGRRLAHAFAAAETPPRTTSIVVCGPYMSQTDRSLLYQRAGERRSLRIVEQLEDPGRLIDLADGVVAMCGYNTACEVVARGKRVLFVPRTRPRREQVIRADALAAAGHAEVMAPHRANARTLAAWLHREGDRPEPHRPIDFGGLDRLPGLLAELVGTEAARVA